MLSAFGSLQLIGHISHGNNFVRCSPTSGHCTNPLVIGLPSGILAGAPSKVLSGVDELCKGLGRSPTKISQTRFVLFDSSGHSKQKSTGRF